MAAILGQGIASVSRGGLRQSPPTGSDKTEGYQHHHLINLTRRRRRWGNQIRVCRRDVGWPRVGNRICGSVSAVYLLVMWITRLCERLRPESQADRSGSRGTYFTAKFGTSYLVFNSSRTREPAEGGFAKSSFPSILSGLPHVF